MSKAATELQANAGAKCMLTAMLSWSLRKARAAVCSRSHIISHSFILLIAPLLVIHKLPTRRVNE